MECCFIGCVLDILQCPPIHSKDEFVLFIHPCALTLQILVIILCQPEPQVTTVCALQPTLTHMAGNQ